MPPKVVKLSQGSVSASYPVSVSRSVSRSAPRRTRSATSSEDDSSPNLGENRDPGVLFSTVLALESSSSSPLPFFAPALQQNRPPKADLAKGIQVFHDMVRDNAPRADLGKLLAGWPLDPKLFTINNMQLFLRSSFAAECLVAARRGRFLVSPGAKRRVSSSSLPPSKRIRFEEDKRSSDEDLRCITPVSSKSSKPPSRGDVPSRSKSASRSLADITNVMQDLSSAAVPVDSDAFGPPWQPAASPPGPYPSQMPSPFGEASSPVPENFWPSPPTRVPSREGALSPFPSPPRNSPVVPPTQAPPNPSAPSAGLPIPAPPVSFPGTLSKIPFDFDTIPNVIDRHLLFKFPEIYIRGIRDGVHPSLLPFLSFVPSSRSKVAAIDPELLSSLSPSVPAVKAMLAKTAGDPELVVLAMVCFFRVYGIVHPSERGCCDFFLQELISTHRITLGSSWYQTIPGFIDDVRGDFFPSNPIRFVMDGAIGNRFNQALAVAASRSSRFPSGNRPSASSSSSSLIPAWKNKAKAERVCIAFNEPKGCKRASCSYEHKKLDTSSAAATALVASVTPAPPASRQGSSASSASSSSSKKE